MLICYIIAFLAGIAATFITQASVVEGYAVGIAVVDRSPSSASGRWSKSITVYKSPEEFGRKKESLLKKLVLTVLVLLAFAVALAACSPVPAAPAAAPTSAAVTATPAPPATEAAPLTVEAVAPTADARPIVPAPVEGERPLASVAAAGPQ